VPLLHNKTLQRFIGGTFLERWGIRVLAEIELFMLGFHKDRATMRQLTKIRRGRRSLITGNEQFIIHAIVAGMRGMEGDIAEVGVYAGSSTRTICEAMGDKRLHVCDTFAGLPKPTSEDRGVEHEAVPGILLPEAGSRGHPPVTRLLAARWRAAGLHRIHDGSLRAGDRTAHDAGNAREGRRHGGAAGTNPL
jgi:Macrocin-O-methyltransferase (TylF)